MVVRMIKFANKKGKENTYSEKECSEIDSQEYPFPSFFFLFRKKAHDQFRNFPSKKVTARKQLSEKITDHTFVNKKALAKLDPFQRDKKLFFQASH